MSVETVSGDYDDLPEVGVLVGGRYRIERTIGSGATGMVFEASHELTGKRVALKWLRPDLAASEALTTRFLREARAATAIDHPDVVSVFDAGRENGSIFLVMELLHGEPLTAFLGRGPHVPSTVIDTLMPALRGVAAAHQRGIVHRDLKPDNIFLATPRPGWRGGAKVLDFGISKLKQPGDGQELTHAGVFLGSPLYMAPEQILAPKDVDGRSDVYSLGVMLYEGLTAQVPFDANTMHELFRKVMQESPPSICAMRPDVPRSLEQVVLRALARRPEERFGSVEELARALEPFGGSRFDVDSSERGDIGAIEAATQPHIRLPEARRVDAPAVSMASLGQAEGEVSPAGALVSTIEALAPFERMGIPVAYRVPLVVAIGVGATFFWGLLLGVLF